MQLNLIFLLVSYPLPLTSLEYLSKNKKQKQNIKHPATNKDLWSRLDMETDIFLLRKSRNVNST